VTLDTKGREEDNQNVSNFTTKRLEKISFYKIKIVTSNGGGGRQFHQMFYGEGL
jgi:hypothetical protein